MRKYLVAVAVGAMLVASQAAAQESAVVNVGDQIGAPTSASNDFSGAFVTGSNNQTYLALFFFGVFLGFFAWGLSSGSGNGTPATP